MKNVDLLVDPVQLPNHEVFLNADRHKYIILRQVLEYANRISVNCESAKDLIKSSKVHNYNLSLTKTECQELWK